MSTVQVQLESLFPLHEEQAALRLDESGTVRIGRSRITLDVVIEQYENGMSPEDMVRAYDTLALADAHDAIAFYLRHPAEVRSYLERREAQAAAVRAQIESERPNISRAELLARRSATESKHAPNVN